MKWALLAQFVQSALFSVHPKGGKKEKMNRCRRCNREISDPNAVFGWRCAEILGVTETLSGMGQDTFNKFLDGVTKAHRLFGNGNLTDEQYKRIYSAFAKQSIWKGVDEKKVKEAKKESYPLSSKDKSKISSLNDDLKDKIVFKQSCLQGK